MSEIYQNPKYDRYNIDFDISVLRVSEPFSFDVGIQPIALPEPFQEIAGGTLAIVSGWGTTKEGGGLPQQLQAVIVPIVNAEACKKAYGETTITERMICAGYTSGGQDACQVIGCKFSMN